MFHIDDVVEILSGQFASYEGRVVATPKLTNFYTYSVEVNGYPVRGLKENQLGLAVNTFLPPTRGQEEESSLDLGTVALASSVLDVPLADLTAPVDDPAAGLSAGGASGGGGSSGSFEVDSDHPDTYQDDQGWDSPDQDSGSSDSDSGDYESSDSSSDSSFDSSGSDSDNW